MTFWDAIKGLLPDSLIKVNNKKVIIIKNSQLIDINGNEINDPNTVKKIFGEINKYKDDDSLPFQILHKDLVEDYFQYENISIEERDSLNQLRKVLDYEDMECIIMARRIILAKKEGQKELLDRLINQIDNNFPKKGKKVLNLMGVKYFDELIIPFIEVYKTKYGEDKYGREYKKFYGEILRFFPLAIFVANYTNEEKLKYDLVKRLKLKVPFVRIHTIGFSNIRKVEKVIEELKIKERFITNDERITTPAGLQSQTFEINRLISKK